MGADMVVPNEGGSLPAGTVTFLLTDVEGSTRMWDADPASASAAMETHDAVVDAQLSAHGGIRPTEQGEGDSLVAVFPWARDALDCAVGLLMALAAEAWPVGSEVRVRMALHTGEAEIKANNYRGAAIIRCARIRNLAHGGQLLVSETTAHVLGDRLPPDVGLLDLGTHELKGLSRPERVFQVTHPQLPAAFPPLASVSSSTEPLPSGAEVPLPAMVTVARGRAMVGRVDQLEQLLEVFTTAHEAGPRFVGLAGEPGIGKTRLTSEFVAQVHEQNGATVLAGRCSEEPLRPFEPFAEALITYTSSTSAPDVMARFGRLAEPLGALVPEFGGPRSVSASRRSSSVMEAGDDRVALFDAVAAAVAQLATSAPVVLVVEDLHWATQPTLLLLQHLLHPSHAVPLTVVGTYRDTELDRMHPLAATLAELARDPRVTRLSLKGLDEAAIARCLRDDESADSTRALARVLREQTDGNPFFVHQLIRHLDDSGDSGKLPEGVREVIGRRLSRLPENVTKALRVASAVGASFDLALLEAVPSAAEDVDDLLDALDLAVEAGLLDEDPSRRDGYTFTHALVRQTLYEEMSSARRARLHGQITDAILSVYGDSPSWLPPLAYHSAESARTGSCGRAVDFALRAAEDARSRLAPEESRGILERGLQVLELETEPCERWEGQLRLALAEALEAALVADGSTDKVDECDAELSAALELSRRSGDVVTFATAADRLGVARGVVGRADPAIPALFEEGVAALGEEAPGLRAELLSDLAHYWMNSGGDQARAEQLSAEAIDVGRASGDPQALLWVLTARFAMLWGEPASGERAQVLAEIESTARQGETVDWDFHVRVYTMRQDLELARPDARSKLGELLAEPTATQRVSASFMSYWEGLIALLDGDFDAAERANETGLARTVHGDFQSIGLAQLFLLRREQGRIAELEPLAEGIIDSVPGLRAFGVALALARAELGRIDEAQAAFDGWAADGFADLRFGLDRAVGLLVLGELLVRIPRPSGADVVYELLLPFAGTCPIAGANACCVGAADRALGQAATVLERWDDAVAHFEDALELETRLQAPPLIARTRYWYAHALLARGVPGDVDRARALLGESEAAARTLGMATLAGEAAALFEGAGSP